MFDVTSHNKVNGLSPNIFAFSLPPPLPLSLTLSIFSFCISLPYRSCWKLNFINVSNSNESKRKDLNLNNKVKICLTYYFPIFLQSLHSFKNCILVSKVALFICVGRKSHLCAEFYNISWIS